MLCHQQTILKQREPRHEREDNSVGRYHCNGIPNEVSDFIAQRCIQRLKACNNQPVLGMIQQRKHTQKPEWAR